MNFKRAISILIAIFIVTVVGYYAYLFLAIHNFHTVTPGEFYRSAQLSRGELIHIIDKYHIKSVLNLRKFSKSYRWYRAEVSVCNKLHVKHIDYGISPKHLLSIKQMNQIIAILRRAPKPILIHCKSGADRSGLVSALWELVIMHKPPSIAAKQLSIIYGHFPYLGSPTIEMDKSFWRYVNYYEDIRRHRIIIYLRTILALQIHSTIRILHSIVGYYSP